MHVFERTGELELTAFNLVGHGIQTLQNGCAICFGDNSLLGQHLYMRARSGDILPPQGLIELDRCIDFFHNGRRSAFETTAPHRIAHCLKPFVSQLCRFNAADRLIQELECPAFV